MNQKLSDWASIAEIISSVAVVVTLIYLSVQVRDGTRATQAASVQAASGLDQEFLLALGADSELAQIWSTYQVAPETLSPPEQLRGQYMLASLLRRLESIYFQNRLGTISEETWASRESMFAYIANSPGYSTYMESPVAVFMDGEFIEYMRQLRSGN